MVAFLVALLAALRSTVRSRTALTLELFALRHQLAVLRRQAPSRLRLHRLDRLVWVGLSRGWASWRGAVQIVSPDTVVRGTVAGLPSIGSGGHGLDGMGDQPWARTSEP